jgi:hypothetical protein
MENQTLEGCGRSGRIGTAMPEDDGWCWTLLRRSVENPVEERLAILAVRSRTTP